jgi:hypothetical protein
MLIKLLNQKQHFWNSHLHRCHTEHCAAFQSKHNTRHTTCITLCLRSCYRRIGCHSCMWDIRPKNCLSSHYTTLPSVYSRWWNSSKLCHLSSCSKSGWHTIWALLDSWSGSFERYLGSFVGQNRNHLRGSLCSINHICNSNRANGKRISDRTPFLAMEFLVSWCC